ncbi:MAG: polysaccharide deacetylase family protein [Clostridiales bacterium]|nr:polysaccharide deacetylase family protein [Clostridiales bacterium]
MQDIKITRCRFSVTVLLITCILMSVLMQTDRTPPADESATNGIVAMSIVEEDPQIAVQYPATGNPAIDQTILAYVNSLLDSFRGGEPPGSGAPASLQLQFQTFWHSEEIVRFSFVSCRSFHKQADAIEHTETLTFRLSDGALLEQDGLYGDTRYLNTASPLTREGLHAIRTINTEAPLQANRTPFGDTVNPLVLKANRLILTFEPCSASHATPADRSALALNTPVPMLREEFLSGEPASEPDAEPEAEPKLPAAEDKLAALTFDDGPHPVLTPQLLDLLEAQGVPATFFVLGSCAKAHPDLVRRIAADGHQLGSHTTNHKDLTKLSNKALRQEIKQTHTLLTELTGQPPSGLRPPYGAYNDAVKRAVNAPLLLWSVDPEDWRYRDAQLVAEHVLEHVEDGGIILLHDIYETSVEAAALIIQGMKEAGYTFVTVDTLISLRGGGDSDVIRALPPAQSGT